MNINSTEHIHGIMQGFSRLTADATDGCRTALHNGTLFCVYRGEGQKIMYMMKPPSGAWGSPIMLTSANASSSYGNGAEPQEYPTQVEYTIVSNNIPSLISFNNKLWLIYTDEAKLTVFRAWDDSHATFSLVLKRPMNIVQSASFAQLNNKLHMFYKISGSNYIYYIVTSDMQTWSAPDVVKRDGAHPATSSLSPESITYQGLIHLIYKDSAGGFFLLKSDGDRWTSSIPLVATDYAHSPGLAVHNGLLTLAFCNLSDALSGPLYQYSYDGHSISPVVGSTLLSAGGSPALNTQDGKLIATYLESVPSL